MTTHYSAIKSLLFANGPTVSMPVASNSMWPLLSQGQKVNVRLIKGPLKNGKCYLFIYKNTLCVHRLLKVKNGQAFFIGDNAERSEKVSSEAVIGELERYQSKMTVFILNLLNQIFFIIFSRIIAEIRIRNKIFAAITRLEKKVYERKV